MYGLVSYFLAFFHTLLYVYFMPHRKTTSDWIEHGLKMLSAKGFTALKADTLSKSLGVSRGSFYWHFEDITAFHTAVLNRWREISTLETMKRIDGVSVGNLRLNLILRQAFQSDHQLERAIRSWAANNDMAGDIVRGVDTERLSYLQAILTSSGIRAETARSRAQFAYWAYLGKVMQTSEVAEMVDAKDIDAFAELLALPPSQ